MPSIGSELPNLRQQPLACFLGDLVDSIQHKDQLPPSCEVVDERYRGLFENRLTVENHDEYIAALGERGDSRAVLSVDTVHIRRIDEDLCRPRSAIAVVANDPNPTLAVVALWTFDIGADQIGDVGIARCVDHGLPGCRSVDSFDRDAAAGKGVQQR